MREVYEKHKASITRLKELARGANEENESCGSAEQLVAPLKPRITMSLPIQTQPGNT